MLRLIPLLLLATAAPAVELYSTGFENFTTGPDRIAGAPASGTSPAIPATDGWTGSHAGQDRSGIYDEASHALPGIGNAGYIGGNPARITTGGSTLFVRKTYNYQPLTTGNEIVTLRLLVGIKDSSPGTRDTFEFLIYNNNSLGGGTAGAFPLAGVQFDNAQINPSTLKPFQTVYRYSYDTTSRAFRYITTGVTFLYDALQALEIRINYRTNRWSATLDTIPLFSDIEFYAGPNARNLGSTLIQCSVSQILLPGSNYMLFDDFSVNADPLSAFDPPVPSFTPGTGLQLRWFQEAGYTYQVQQSTLLSAWANVPGTTPTPATSTGFSGLHTDSATAGIPRRYYRVTRTAP